MIVTPLRDYQLEAVEAAEPYPGFGIWCEQRTGKCLIALSLADRRRVDRLLIVTLKKGIRVWEQQIKEHLSRDHGIRIIVINYEQLRKDRDFYRKWLTGAKRSSMMVTDESHRLKGRGSVQSQTCKYIAWKKNTKTDEWIPQATYRLCLTGTPIAQGRFDAYGQFRFMDPSIFGSWEAFSERFVKMGGFRKKQPTSCRRPLEFDRIFHTYSFRVTLREARKEPLYIKRSVIPVSLESAARRLYRAYETDLEHEAVKRKPLVKNVLEQAMRLQQITGGSVKTPDGWVRISRSKEQALEALIKRHPGERLVICARFSHEIKQIKQLCRKLNLTCKTIEGGIEFDGLFDVEVIVIQIQAGVAIDLKESNYLIFYSWDHSLINYEQMKFRILTYSKRKVTYYYLVATGTIDELMYASVRNKKKLATVVCDWFRRKNRGQEGKASARVGRGGFEDPHSRRRPN